MPGTETKKIVFDSGGTSFYIQVAKESYEKAAGLFDAVKSDSDKRECMEIAKLIQGGKECRKAASEAWDVEVKFGAAWENIDLKALFVPGYMSTASSKIRTALITDEIDSAMNKEERQGAICLFDLSYIPDDIRPAVIVHITKKQNAVHYMRYDASNADVYLDGAKIK